MYNLNITSFPFQGALEFVRWLNTMKLEQETHFARGRGRERNRVAPLHLSDKLGWCCQAGTSSLQTPQLHSGAWWEMGWHCSGCQAAEQGTSAGLCSTWGTKTLQQARNSFMHTGKEREPNPIPCAKPSRRSSRKKHKGIKALEYNWNETMIT